MEKPYDIYDYEVLDRSGRRLGPITGFWVDESTGKPEFASVKTGWLAGKQHVIPIRDAFFDYNGKKLRVPYDERTVRDAPGFASAHDFSPEEEERIYSHYRLERSLARSPSGLAGRAGEREGGLMGRERPAMERPALERRAAERETTEIPLYEERVDVGKEMVEGNQVRLRKVVRTETVNVPVDLTRERIEIERIPADQLRGTYTGRAFGESEDIVLTERREEPVIRKHDEVIGGVRAHREVEHERRDVSTSVRREDVEVDREGERTGFENP